MKEICSSLACNRRASHRIMWKEVDVSIVVCPEHLNVFLVDQLEVTTDLKSEWRLPNNAQIILQQMTDQINIQLDEGRLKDAGESVGVARAHLTACMEGGLELDTTNLTKAEDRLVAMAESNAEAESQRGSDPIT